MICSHLSAFEALALLGAFLSGHQLGVLEPTHTEALVSCQDGGGVTWATSLPAKCSRRFSPVQVQADPR